MERAVASKADGVRRLATGEPAGYQPALRKWAGIASRVLENVSALGIFIYNAPALKKPMTIKRFSSVRMQLVASVFLWISPALLLTFIVNQSWFWEYAPEWMKQYALTVPWESFIVGLLALVAAWYGGEHFILRQVRALYRAVQRLSSGDFEARTGLHQVEGELGQLAEKFDEMAAALQQRAQERDAAERKLRDHAHQQTIVAALGQCALVINDLDTLFTQGAIMSGQMLAIEYSALFERLADGRLLLLAGTGWKTGTVGQTYVFDDKATQPGFTAITGEVAVVDDITLQSDFKLTPLLEAHGVVGGITAAIPTRGLPFGVLAVFTTRKRVFTPDEVQFLLSAANTIGMAAERRRAEAAMQKLASFVKENPNPALEISADGSITYLNGAAERLAQAVGRAHPREILPPDVSDIAASCLQSGVGRSNLETKIADHTISWSFHPVLSSKVVHCYGEDITTRLSLEEQLFQSQKMESIGQLAAGVAHDFNNMLTIIQGHTSKLLMDQNLAPAVQDAALAVHGAAERAAGLTRQLLMFSRKNIMQPRPLNLHDVVASLTKMLGRLLGENITLRFDCPENPPPIYGDAGMVDQILMNLAVNARDAMPNGGELTVAVEECWVGPDYLEHHPDARIGHFVRLQVTDTGCGMSAKIRARIFEPFFTTKEPGKGTGLGLATVFGIVKQHAGWIEVASEVACGTTFTIFFPASEEMPEPRMDTAFLTAAAAARGSETVLVVEDEVVLREMARDFLKDCGYRILEANSGREALQVWAEHRTQIDLLLTDMKMPEGISGMDLAEKMIAEQPSLRVIFTSGYSDDIVSPEVLERNNARFLPKPYSYSDLTRMVREALTAPGGNAAA
jgi:signal transduction histidine kinase/CheY-like chemotaxis protein/HAMP domain-containing protein